MTSTFRLATCNAKKELGPTAAKSVIRTAAGSVDIVGWQEIETAAHKAGVAGLTGFTTYWPHGKRGPANAVPISWRTDRFKLVYKNKQRLHLGVRKVTPARYVVWVVLEDRATKDRFAVVNCHLISQAWTSHPERRTRWTRSTDKVSKRVAVIVKNWGALVGTGDMNRDRYRPDGTVGVWTQHGTCGSAHYDTLYRSGKVALQGVPSRIETASDHDILTATFRRTA